MEYYSAIKKNTFESVLYEVDETGAYYTEGNKPERSGGLWECGTTLEFLSPFLWRAPPIEMRRERQEFFPEHAGKGSLLSS